MKDRSESYWRSKLSEEQFQALRRNGTEAPYSGKYLDHSAEGVYKCAGCGSVLFKSDSKFNSPPPNAGWPSFSRLAKEGVVEEQEDFSFGMRRTKVICANCGGHLGHYFDDGPEEDGGKHYCINSICLDFKVSSDEAGKK